ncbi:hypothetical protein [Streptomyces sp. NPDC059460]|uniref:hypothetical protein n=1 Tax=Streptomyces sp. NPDC059460 TaxID=3346840 RepID=UPI0036BF7BF4
MNTKLPDYNPAVPVPSQLTIGAAGWSNLAGVQHEMALQDSSRIETGNTYIVPLTKYRTGEGWGLTSAQPHTGVSPVDTPDARLAAYNAATYPSDPAEEEPEPPADFPPVSDPGVD